MGVFMLHGVLRKSKIACSCLLLAIKGNGMAILASSDETLTHLQNAYIA